MSAPILKYTPIDPGIAIDCSLSNLIGFSWYHKSADFEIPGEDSKVLRVQFNGQVIARILDEMPMSTETHPDTWEGLVPCHLAYRVEGSEFEATQSEAWKVFVGPVTHYSFLTGCGCLDVLSPFEPSFAVVPFDLNRYRN